MWLSKVLEIRVEACKYIFAMDNRYTYFSTDAFDNFFTRIWFFIRHFSFMHRLHGCIGENRDNNSGLVSTYSCASVTPEMRIHRELSKQSRFFNQQDLDPFVVPYRVPDDYEAIQSSWGVYTRGFIWSGRRAINWTTMVAELLALIKSDLWDRWHTIFQQVRRVTSFPEHFQLQKMQFIQATALQRILSIFLSIKTQEKRNWMKEMRNE